MTGLLLALGLLLHEPAVTPPSDRCVCRDARGAGGWCAVHQVGYLGGVRITSTWLYDTMDAHGHEVDPATFPCPACRRAIEEHGFCREHRVGFVQGKAYFSILTHHLAKGEVRQVEGIPCRRCRRNARSHGWCRRCGVGMVGSIVLRSRPEFEEAVQAVGVLRAASATAARCHHCAAAMVTDTQCPFCRIRYRSGKAVP